MKSPSRLSIRAAGVALVACVVASAPAAAQWHNWTDETSIRLSGDSATLLDDTKEKDYAWGDVDNDGDIDLVVVRKEPFTSPGKETNVLLLNEGGVLTDRTDLYAVDSSVAGDMGFLTATNDRDVKLVDVDGDTWLDIVTAVTISDNDPKHIGHPRIYINQRNDGGGNWLGFRYEDAWIPTMLSHNGTAGFNPRFCSIGVGDLTGDGRPELWFGDYDSSGAGGNTQPADADFNDRLLFNNGGINYVDETQARLSGLIEIPDDTDTGFEISAFGAASIIVDVNGDGFNDIVKQTALNPPQYVGVSYADGSNPGFFDNHEVVNQSAPYFVSAGDLNQDNLMDLVITDDGADRYLINNGVAANGNSRFTEFTFAFENTGDDGFGSNSLITDIDQDGWPDVLIADVDVDEAGCNRRMHIYHNQGGTPGDTPVLLEETGGTGCGNGSNPSTCLVGGIPANRLTGVHDVAVFDIDGDGWDDMVVGRCSGTEVWRGLPMASISFSLPATLPDIIDPLAVTAVQVEVVPAHDTIAAGTEALFASINGGPYVEYPMTGTGGNIYEGNLPALPACLDKLKYYFSAQLTSGGTFTFPETAPLDTFEAIGAFDTLTRFSESFEGDVSAWTVQNDGFVFGGIWEHGVPIITLAGVGVVAAPGEDSEDTGTKAYVTDIGLPGGAAETSDIDQGPTNLISPVFDTGVDGFISFDAWAFSQGGTPDQLLVQLSNDGSNWTTAVALGPDQNDWRNTKIRVSDVITPSASMQARFRMGDNPNNSITEGGVDAFRVESFVCTNCTVDADCIDTNYCNGVEVCNAGVCEPGPDPCPGQVCDETTDTCLDCFIDSDCDDGNFCNGTEMCGQGNMCIPGSDPCPSAPCDETLDSCVSCLVDANCDDGLFCNGAETCNGGVCSPPVDACPGQTCDEGADACVGNITLQPHNGEPLNGLDSAQLLRFETGKTMFNLGLTAADGLGPIFNQDSCASCHSNPVGGSGSITVTRFGFSDPVSGAFDPLADLGGSLLQHSTISTPCAESIPIEANVSANRVTPTILGFGLVEAVDDADILAASVVPPPGVSGQPHMVEALEAPGVPRVGRFGWKAQVATLLTFSADAARNEMGLTNRLLGTENAPNGDQALLAMCDTVADPEDTPDAEGFDFVDRVTDFQRFLAPPPQTPRSGMTGETIFGTIGCASCHTPAFTTKNDPALEAVFRNKVIRPYSDFLLHDMGLNADFIEQGNAGEREIRTPPLWGLRTRDPIWHDGRAAGGTFDTRVRSAIALHDAVNSEALVSVQSFNALSTADQDALVAFLDSLGRAEFDHDGDGDVDLDDHVTHQACFTGPGSFYTADDPCAISDVDRDGDVDDDDFTLFDTVVEADSGMISNLTLDKSGGMLQLDWASSCNSGDNDYAIYEGTIGGSFDNHASRQCGTGGATSESFSIPGGDLFYLVVPLNGLREGSYGLNGSGAERSAGAGACATQAVGVCQ